jgi:hypothetical protein
MAGVGHGAGAVRPCARHGGERKRGREKEIRSDRWGPRGRETMSGRWAGGYGGLKGQAGWRSARTRGGFWGALEDLVR